jgi:molybdenum cofactor guanylyltransferase
MKRGAIILCGGKSVRMGRDKAMLPFGAGEVLLQRVVRLVGRVVPADRVICVAGPGQALPKISADIEIVFDRAPQQGPLGGLAGGLRALENKAEAAFVTGCDAPLLVPAFVERMFELLGDDEIAAPHDGQRWHPLAAVYRTNLWPRAEALFMSAQTSIAARGERRLVALVESCRSRQVSIDELRGADPALASLAACNTPDDYQNALRMAGLPVRK